MFKEGDAFRHMMMRSELNKLYCDLCDFHADLTREEADECRDAINEIKSVIHKRMQEQ